MSPQASAIARSSAQYLTVRQAFALAALNGLLASMGTPTVLAMLRETAKVKDLSLAQAVAESVDETVNAMMEKLANP